MMAFGFALEVTRSSPRKIYMISISRGGFQLNLLPSIFFTYNNIDYIDISYIVPSLCSVAHGPLLSCPRCIYCV